MDAACLPALLPLAVTTAVLERVELAAAGDL